MPSETIILDTMPSAKDFFGQYWNQCPFIVRNAIPENVMQELISAEELAALSMEEEPRCRLIRSEGIPQNWSCRFGPFTEQDLSSLGDRNWSLMIQNVEQFHPDTAALLPLFNIAPRWMMDDVMVSFSATDGTVGPHIDSYHVFLVQGQGKRRWKLSHEPITNDNFIYGMDLKVLEKGFEGKEIEVSCGDILYVPPRFGHEGITLEPAMTYSVGFLGPKMSELFSAYGQYLSENEENDRRYVGHGLVENSTGFIISDDAINALRRNLTDSLETPGFAQWLVEFFTESSHEDFGIYTERETPLSLEAFKEKLEQGAALIKPDYIKLAATDPASGIFHLGFDAQSFILDESLYTLVHSIMTEAPLNIASSPSILGHTSTLGFLLELYNHQALEFVE